jgi:hypothetical protein
MLSHNQNSKDKTKNFLEKIFRKILSKYFTQL